MHRFELSTMEKHIPELPDIRTIEENVVNILLLILTKMILRRDRNTNVTRVGVGRDFIMSEKPNEGLYLLGVFAFHTLQKFLLVWG